MKMKKCQGSFTIEAAIIVPVILFLMLAVICIAVELCQETVQLAEELSKKECVDVIRVMYHLDSIRGVLDGLRK